MCNRPVPAALQELTEDAAALLGKYERLNDGGKKDLHNRADELIALGKTIEEDAKKDSIRSARKSWMNFSKND